MTETPINEKMRQFFVEKIDSGYLITDKTSAINLRKQCLEKFNLKYNAWFGNTQRVLNQVMKEKNIIIGSRPSATDAGGGIEGKATKEFTEIAQKPQPTSTEIEARVESSHGTLPKDSGTEGKTSEEKIVVWDDKKKQQYERMAKNGFEFLKEMYVDFGLVKKKEEKEKPKEDFDQFSEKVDKFAVDVADTAFDNQWQIPAWVEFVGLIASFVTIFGLPVLKKLFEPNDEEGTKEAKEKKEKEKKLENLET